MADATERAIQRAANADKQKGNYSGKKKHHTVKNTGLTTSSKFILFLGKTVGGGTFHDFTLFQKDFPTDTHWFEWVELWVDLGYLGIDKKYNILQLHLPHKKPRKSKHNPTAALSQEQKLENKLMSQIRVVVENAIAGMKRYQILVQKLRTQCEKFADDVIELCAGLWNFKLSFKNAK